MWLCRRMHDTMSALRAALDSSMAAARARVISQNFIMIAALRWEHVNIMTVMSASIAYKCWRR